MNFGISFRNISAQLRYIWMVSFSLWYESLRFDYGVAQGASITAADFTFLVALTRHFVTEKDTLILTCKNNESSILLEIKQQAVY